MRTLECIKENWLTIDDEGRGYRVYPGQLLTVEDITVSDDEEIWVVWKGADVIFYTEYWKVVK